MRSLTPKYRIFGYTLPEVIQSLSGSCNEFQFEIKLNGRKLKEGPMLSALILAFSALPLDKQKAFLRDGVGRLEALMAEDDPFGTTAAPTPTTPAPKTGTHHEPGKGTKSSVAKPSSRKKAP